MRHILNRPVAVAGLISASMLGFAACGGSSKPAAAVTPGANGFPVSYTRCGRTTTFTGPQRVLVKEPEAAAIVAAAGGNMTNRIVDVAFAGYQPIGPHAATLAGAPILSPTHDLSKESIIGQKPDLVMAHGFELAPQDQLAAVGIKSMTVNPCCDSYAAAHGGRVGYDAIYDDVTMMGQLLGTQSYAASSVATMKSTVAAVTKQAPSLVKHLAQPTAAFTVLISGTFFTYGTPSIANTEIQTLGLTNAFNLPKRGTQLSAETFIARDPGVLVIGYEPGPGGEAANAAKIKRELLAIPGISRMTAIRHNRYVILPYNYLLSLPAEGVRVIADQMAKFT